MDAMEQSRPAALTDWANRQGLTVRHGPAGVGPKTGARGRGSRG